MKKTDSIKSKLKKLKDDFGKEKVESIGVLDLREWESRIIKLQYENSRLIDEARYDVDVDNDELRALFKESDALWEEMSQALETITKRVEFVNFDESKLTGTYVRYPNRDELNIDINESFIVEFYNR